MRELLDAQALDQVGRQLQRTARSQGFARDAAQNRPAAHEEADLSVGELERVKAGLGGDIEVVDPGETPFELAESAARTDDRFAVGERQAGERRDDLLGNDGDRSDLAGIAAKEAPERVAHAEQGVGAGVGDTDFDTALEFPEELPKIGCHDRELAEREHQEYSARPPK